MINYQKKFFSIKPKKNELFKVFITSQKYERQQINAKEKIQVKDDPDGNKFASDELKKYNKINFWGYGIIQIDLYPDSGKISRIRFIRPSGLSEIDKMISEDITRWHFLFPEDKIEPVRFTISYGVLLENTIERNEALKELKKYAY